MNRAVLAGTGSGIPKRNVPNEILSQFLDTDDEWIRSRTGIKTRFIATDETLTELCVNAAIQALKAAGIAASDLDMIIVATLTPDRPLPNAASDVQKALKAAKAVCFDLNAACSGFLFALSTASMYIGCGMAKNVLVIGGEVLSKIMDWSDRGTCILFGDGAGAAVLTSGGEIEEDCPVNEGILGFELGSDGSRGDVLSLSGRPIINPFTADKKTEESLPYVHMNGQDVFKFAVSTVPKCIKSLLSKNDVDVQDVDYFILHQANLRIIKSVARRLGVSEDKFMINMDKYGNTSAASIPLALDEAVRKGHAKKGDMVVVSGFGGGLTWGSMLICL